MSKRVSNSKATSKARRTRVRIGWRKRRAAELREAALDRARVDGMLAASVPTPAPAMPDGLLDKARRFMRLGGR